MKVETKVGLLFLVAIVLTIGFAYLLGAFNPFTSSRHIMVAFNFAGGIEVGSPVRVMGIKVGKVESIKFEPGLKMPSGEEVKLKVKVSISEKAWPTVRQDSEFYINMAGVIGERYLEVTPGTLDHSEFKSGALVRGQDPPRIDQLLSQGYGLAGKILELVEKNEGDFTNTIQMMNELVTNFNKTLVLMDKTTKNVKVSKLLQNLVSISDDVAHVSKRLSTNDADNTIELVHELLWRLKALDKDSIRKFLQEEGIKARMAF